MGIASDCNGNYLETRLAPGHKSAHPNHLVLVSVGLAIGVVLVIDLADVVTRPQVTLPAAFYALSVLIAAYFLGPRDVTLVSTAAVVAQSLVGLTHESPVWTTGIEILELALIGVLCVILSARIRREAGLKAVAEISLLQFRGVVEGMMEGVIVFALDGQVVGMNPPALRMYGLHNEDEALGRLCHEVSGLVDMRPPGGQAISSGECPMSRVLRGEVLRDLEMEIRGSDGSLMTVVFNGSLVQNNAGGEKVGLLTIRDVTERYHAQARLLDQERALAAMEERGRLARELHDNLGDVLSYVVAEGQAVRALLATGNVSTADEYLDRAVSAAQDAIGDMREYVSGLKLAAASGGLYPAVAELLGRLEYSQGVRTKMVVAPGLREEMIGSADRFQLLRITQEALANVRKHSGANSVTVVIKRECDHICAVIEDDGRGFDVDGIRADSQAFGMAIMRERAEERGGSLQVVSSPGQGTRIVARLPMPRGEAVDLERIAHLTQGYGNHEDINRG